MEGAVVMGIKDILVHLDNSAASASRLDVAIAYARKHNAALRGLYLITHLYYEPSDLGERAALEKAEQLFVTRTSEAGVPSEWIFQDYSVMGASVCDLVTLHAYYTDLVILGQADTSAPVAHIPVDLAERVALTCGRPVLIVPYAGIFKTAGDRIMVAWKAGRETIRAVNESLAIMQKSYMITIMEIETTGHGKSASLECIKKYLATHELNVRNETINSGDFPIGDILLNSTCENNIDLLIMGAFAPNRRGKLELSSIARHIIRHLTVPLLIAH
jgi:nucleotide-binding universal stress UspA family protein